MCHTIYTKFRNLFILFPFLYPPFVSFTILLLLVQSSHLLLRSTPRNERKREYQRTINEHSKRPNVDLDNFTQGVIKKVCIKRKRSSPPLIIRTKTQLVLQDIRISKVRKLKWTTVPVPASQMDELDEQVEDSH